MTIEVPDTFKFQGRFQFILRHFAMDAPFVKLLPILGVIFQYLRVGFCHAHLKES